MKCVNCMARIFLKILATEYGLAGQRTLASQARRFVQNIINDAQRGGLRPRTNRTCYAALTFMAA